MVLCFMPLSDSTCLHWDLHLTQYNTNAERREMSGKTRGEKGEKQRETSVLEIGHKKYKFLCVQLTTITANRELRSSRMRHKQKPWKHIVTLTEDIHREKKTCTHRVFERQRIHHRHVSYGIMPEAAHPVIQLKPSLLKCHQTLFNQRLISSN